ncbi:acyltransferase, partial [bacterium]|nr:acyltransferase [bacterium]
MGRDPAADGAGHRSSSSGGTAEARQGEGWRSDVDGLRAVAVLAVIVFHLRRDWLPGGFAGVDVFFVISGFLITRAILADLAAGTFSRAEFYRRRVKRISLPMLAVVLVVV